MRVGYLDIETTPHLGHVWGLWQQNISLSQLQQATEMLCFVAKFRGEKKVRFHASDYAPSGDSQAMVQAAHDILDEADVIVHYNGRRFDVPHLNREFAAAGFRPPSPFKQVDLLETVKRRFKLASNKLAYVSEFFGLDGKVEHEGHSLWVKCMAGDTKAWRDMKKYNVRDVTLLEELHDKLLPWIPNHPNAALIDGLEGDHCHQCASENLVKEGRAYTKQGAFQRFHCADCGAWSRSGRRLASVDIREVSNV